MFANHWLEVVQKEIADPNDSISLILLRRKSMKTKGKRENFAKE